MCCASSVVLSNSRILCCAASHSYLSSIYKSYNKNNPEISGFCCVAKERYFFKEDYYV